MYCPMCGAQIPDDSAFCRNCGAAIPGRAPKAAPEAPKSEPKSAPKETPELFKNLLNTCKAFFTAKPEEGLSVAESSKTHEWAILLGLNILIFAFAFAVNMRKLYSGIISGFFANLGEFGTEFWGSNFRALFGFGYFFLFGLLIAIFANAIVFIAYYLLEKVVHHGDQTLLSTLHTVAYSTIPFTLACFLAIFLGLVWAFFSVPLLLIAALAQVLLLYYAIRKHAKFEVNHYVFLAVCLGALFLTLLLAFLFTRAAGNAGARAAVNRFSSFFGS